MKSQTGLSNHDRNAPYTTFASMLRRIFIPAVTARVVQRILDLTSESVILSNMQHLLVVHLGMLFTMHFVANLRRDELDSV